MNKPITLDVLKEILPKLKGKVDRIEMPFDGESDSGCIDSVTFIKGSQNVQLDDDLTFLKFKMKRNQGWSGKVIDLEESLEECLTEVGYSVLPGGWEINEGSFGTIIISVETGKVKLEFNQRLESSEYSENEW